MRVDVTNADLKTAVAERRFREDLLYRLHVLPIRVPSLGERRDDVPELVRSFVDAGARQAYRHDRYRGARGS